VGDSFGVRWLCAILEVTKLHNAVDAEVQASRCCRAPLRQEATVIGGGAHLVLRQERWETTAALDDSVRFGEWHHWLAAAQPDQTGLVVGATRAI
jgi:hypothetical protein